MKKSLALLIALITHIGALFAQEVAPPIEWNQFVPNNNYLEGSNIMHIMPNGHYLVVGNGQTPFNTKHAAVFDTDGDSVSYTLLAPVVGNMSILGLRPVPEGGYIVCGTVRDALAPFDGQVARGVEDAALVRLNADFELVWAKRYGGPGRDLFKDVEPVVGGGFVAVGTTTMVGGDVSAKSDTVPGWEDYWFVRVNDQGDILNEKAYGGHQGNLLLSSREEPNSITRTPAGNFVVAGITSSLDGDVSAPIEARNWSLWILHINPDLELIWDRSIGGSGYDNIPTRALFTADGQLVIGASTSSVDGDMDGLGHGGGQYIHDVYVTKLDLATGATIWGRCYGGGSDEGLSHETLRLLPDGNIVFASTTTSTDYDVRGNHGSSDLWLVKVDQANGDTIWTKAYGGTLGEGASAMVVNEDGSIVVLGHISSRDGDLVGERFSVSMQRWLVKFAVCNTELKLVKQICAGEAYNFNGTPVYDAGQYRDTLFSSDGCNYPLVLSLIHRAVQPTIDLQVDDNTLIVQDHFNSYVWSYEGQVMRRQLTNVVQADESGTFQLIVMDSLFCVSDTLEYYHLYNGCVAPRGYGERMYGGSHNELGNAVMPWKDGYLLAGSAMSTNPSFVHGLKGTRDAWLVAVDAVGDTLWTRTLGGGGQDQAWELLPLSDGGFMLLAQATIHADMGDITATPPVANGAGDAWLVRFNADAEITWQGLYGGSGTESLGAIDRMADGYIMVGSVANNSTGGTLTGHASNGGVDGWVLRIDDAGNVLSTARLGGGGRDEFSAVRATPDGGYIAVGFTAAHATLGTFADVQRPTADSRQDLWVVKFAADNTIEWQKLYGTSRLDQGSGVLLMEDGGYMITGYSDMDVPDGTLFGVEKHGGADVWLLRLDAAGEVVWQKTYGGSSDETINVKSIIQDEEGFLVAAMSRSVDGQATGVLGGEDIWVFRTDAAGEMIWQRSWGSASADLVNAFIPANDGQGYIAVGTVAPGHIGHNGGNDFLFLKLGACATCTDAERVTICAGESFDFAGATYTAAGVYRDTVSVSDLGCVNDRALQLTLIEDVVTHFRDTICAGDTYLFFDQEFVGAGVHRIILTANITGCDSVLELDLQAFPMEMPVIQQDAAELSVGEYASYRWFLGGQELLAANGPTYQPTAGGVYTVEVTNAQGCVLLSEGYFYSGLGVGDAAFRNLALVPNPASDLVQLLFDRPATYRLLDLTGKELLWMRSRGDRTTLDVSTLQAGVYLVETITDDGGTAVRRLVKR